MTMLQALAAPRRATEIPDEADLYGWLIGSWSLDVIHYLVDVREQQIQGEAHFGWVLEGRAMQDVWIMRRDGVMNTYGSTLRVWDAALGAWRVSWSSPTTGARDELIGRRVGDDLVQLGTHRDGRPIRWSFTEITDRSFRWTGEVLQHDGSWSLEAEFRATRLP